MDNPQEDFSEMCRFDPNEDSHSKYQIDVPHLNKTSKKQSKKENDNSANVEVSKDVFYKVNTDLKEVLDAPSKPFSLLEKWGKAHDDLEVREDEKNEPHTQDEYYNDEYFNYDWNETDDVEQSQFNNEYSEKPKNQNTNILTEPFFIKTGDPRLKEGFDFVQRIASIKETNEEFAKVREEIKSIVKTKSKAAQMRNKPFKKKIGVQKRKNINKINKALQR